MSTEQRFLLLEEVAARYNTSVETIERAMAAGLLPAVKTDGLLGWPLEQIRLHEATVETLVAEGYADPYRNAGFSIMGVPIDEK